MLAAELVIDLLSEAGKITDKNPYVWLLVISLVTSSVLMLGISRTAIDERANFQVSTTRVKIRSGGLMTCSA